ncbi:DUF2510 domain-containing protein [Salana multivorans]
MIHAPAGWYNDGADGQRWWDGAQWTEHSRSSDFAPAGWYNDGAGVQRWWNGVEWTDRHPLSKEEERQSRKEERQRARDAKLHAQKVLLDQETDAYGRPVEKAQFGWALVEIFDKGYVRVNGGQCERLLGISYSRTVKDKSAGGRALAGAASAGLSYLASNERLDVYLSIVTERVTHRLKAKGRAAEAPGLALEAAGQAVLQGRASRTGAGAVQSTGTPVVPDIPAQLLKLKELHEVGVLTDDEYQAKKVELLSRM